MKAKTNGKPERIPLPLGRHKDLVLSVKTVLPGLISRVVSGWTHSASESLRSPLIRRVSLLIFASIVIIEAVLLLFSYFTERERLLIRMDDALQALAPLLQADNTVAQLDILLSQQSHAASESNTNSPYRSPAGSLQLLGYAYQIPDQPAVTKGSSAGLDTLNTAVPSSQRLRTSDNTYDTSLVFSDGRRLTVRLDADYVATMLAGYVTRILLMVLLISVFVTVTCVLALRSNFLFPIINLRHVIKHAQLKGIDAVEIPSAELQRTDEVGSVYRGFERLQHSLRMSQAKNVEMSERFQQFAELGADCFFETDRRHRICFLAGDFHAVLGLTEQQLQGSRPNVLTPKGVELSKLLTDLKNHGEWEGKIHRFNGDTSYVRIRVTPKYAADGQYRGSLGTVIDATESAVLARQLAHQASHDELTGLINRREFDKRLTAAFQNQLQENSGQCLMMLDLDKFKRVNDNCGHAAGDILLQQIAELIRYCVHESDTVARFGGDEFSLILHHCTADRGLEVAEKLRRSIAEYTFHWGGEVYDLGASIGVAMLDASMHSAHDALIAADSSCFKAKNLGRNRVVVFDPDDLSHQQQQGEMQWIKVITDALEHERIKLFYQWCEYLGDETDPPLHMDITPRLLSATGEMFSPEAYLPAAERFSLLSQINRAVVTQGLEWLSAQTDLDSTQVIVSFTLAESALRDPVFHEFLIDKIDTMAINPSHLCFVFPESALIQYASGGGQMLNDLKSIGCNLGIEKFECGFNAIAAIQQLPLDYLKFGGDYMASLCKNPVDQTFIKSVSEVAGHLDLTTIATQVNCPAVAALLTDFGVNYAQGDVFSEVSLLTDINTIAARHINATTHKRNNDDDRYSTIAA